MVERPIPVLQGGVTRPTFEVQLFELCGVVVGLCAIDRFQGDLHAVNVVNDVIARIAQRRTLHAHEVEIFLRSPNACLLLKFALSAVLQRLSGIE